MTLIEGVGDEVTNFFVIMVAFLVGWLAWCSTSIADQPLLRTVLILRHRRHRRIAQLRTNRSSSSLNRPPNLESSEEDSIETVTNDNNDDLQNCPEPSIADTNGSDSSETHETPETAATEEVLIAAMDSFNNDDETLLQRQNKLNTSKKTNVSASSAESTEGVENEAENLSGNDDANEISIKLKFINDDQKVVTGSLKELLGDFKRRHFQIELEAQKMVRLVFNGRVLQPDSQTLEKCGLFNNCVVHCLIHQPRPNPAPSQSSTLDNSSSIYFNPQSFTEIPAGTGISTVQNEWDLGRLLLRILALMLGLAWYSRYHYAQLFTATTTLALYALTALFAISFVSNFFPDQDNIRNIE